MHADPHTTRMAAVGLGAGLLALFWFAKKDDLLPKEIKKSVAKPPPPK